MQVNAVSAGSMFYVSSGGSPVSVATALALAKQYPKTKFSISDTNENINNNLDALQKVANNVTAVTLTDVTQALSITASQLKKDATLLGKIAGSYKLNVRNVSASNAAAVAAANHVVSVNVSDSSAAIASNINALQANAEINQIVQTGTVVPLNLTAAQYAATKQGVLTKIAGSFTVAINSADATQAIGYTGDNLVKSVSILDSSANIAANLDALKELGLRIKEIRSNQTSIMSVTADQVKNDSLVLGKIYNSYQLAVVNATTVQMAALASNKKVVSIDIADTGSNIVRSMAFLKKLGSELRSIDVTDVATPLSITADQWAQHENEIGKITTSNLKLAVKDVGATYAEAMAVNSLVDSIEVKDTSANIAARLVALNGNTKVRTITQAGPLEAMTLTASQLSTTATARGKIVGNYSLNVTDVAVTAAKSLADGNSHIVSMTLTGSASDIVSKLTDLNVLGDRVSSITQSDSSPTALALSHDQWINQSNPLNKITGGYRATVSDVSAAQAADIASNGHVSSVQVTDTAANLQQNLDQLQALGSQVSAVTNSDVGTLTITASQLQGNSSLLSKFDALTLNVTDVAAGNAAVINADDRVATFHVSDSSANIALKLDALEALDADGKLASINQKGTLTPLHITYTQLGSDTATLGKIEGGYSLAVSGVDVADAATVAGNAKVVSMSVTGSAADIATHLTSLNALGKKVTGILQSDPANNLVLSADQWFGQAAALRKITGGFRATVGDVTADKAQAVASDSRVLSMVIKDTALNLSKQLNVLQSLGDRITGIDQSDQNSLRITADQWSTDQQALGKFNTAPDLIVDQSLAAQADTIAADARVITVNVKDSSANVANNLASLQSLTGVNSPKLGGIKLTDSAPLSITEIRRGLSTTALSKITGNYSLALTEMTAADAIAQSTNAKVVSMSVTDTAAHIVGAMTGLNALGKKLVVLAQSDLGTPLALTSDQWFTKSAVLNKLSGGFTATVSDVAASKAGAVLADDRVSSIKVKDTRANINAQLGALENLGVQVSSIQQTDVGRLNLTAAQWTAFSSSLSKFTVAPEIDISQATASALSTIEADGRVKSIAVSDTSSNVSANWTALAASTALNSIVQTGVVTPLTLTATQFTNGTSTLGKISGSYSVDVTAADAATAQTLSSNSHVASIDVTDTRATVATKFAELSANSKLSAIHFTGANNPMALTQSLVLNGMDTLAKVQDLYTLAVSDVTTAHLMDLADNLPINSMTVSDTSDHVSAAFDTLQSLGDTVSSIAVSDAATDAIELTYGQLQSGAATLAKMSGAYQLAVSDVPADAASAVAATQDTTGNNVVSAMTVTDTANNIALNIDALSALGSALQIISLTDSDPIELTQVQADSNAATLAKILGNFTVDIVA